MQVKYTQKILGVEVKDLSKEKILENIIKYIKQPSDFFHIVSLNPENIVMARKNPDFDKVVRAAQIRIVDGVGIIRAGQILGFSLTHRVTGVGLMEDLMKIASQCCLRVLLIGGKPNLAEKLAKCYQQKYPEAKFLGLEGIKNIQAPKIDEEKAIFSIVTDFKPHLVFAAFGSPAQEMWLERHKTQFKGAVVMGVGGAFDFLAGSVPRAPLFVQKIGFEWFFRLVNEPWRWKRQLRLIEFGWMVLKQKFNL